MSYDEARAAAIDAAAKAIHDYEGERVTCPPPHGWQDHLPLARRAVDAAWSIVRGHVRAQTLAEAAACAECFDDEASDDLWERAERAGWRVL